MAAFFMKKAAHFGQKGVGQINIDIIAVGKIKERYLREGLKEYEKRLAAYCRLRTLEVPEEKVPEKLSLPEREQLLSREGKWMLDRLPPHTFLIALCLEGEQFSSEEMARKLSDLAVRGHSHLTFLIGGSLGLADELKRKADLLLSFSRFTFPHQLMRLILLEQIYRWFKIIRGEPYHK
jgi:23S rRNA (pseudouridine1915-N3)-methyltransferase